ncbi:MAG: ribonuclease J [Vicinamibacteria bacterium]|nr:ribonuclease J [Vicinamibacteria bacterium]
MDDLALRLIPIGGLGEFGMNSLFVEWNGRRLLLDTGLMFPRTDHPGIDKIVPDFESFTDHRGDVDGIVLTHGHEDHIGALVFAHRAFPVPIYGTPLTLALARRRLDEHDVKADMRPMTPGTPVDIGPFRIHPIRVAHSIPDCVALAIETPCGVVLTSADFKIENGPTPVERTNVDALAAWGDRGVIVLLADSTNVEQVGRTPSDDAVVPAFEQIFDRAEGRVIVSCFATAIPRIERVARVAMARGRRLCFLGRRMAENVGIAIDLDLVSFSRAAMIAPEDADRYAPENLAFFASGSQGEPFSALSLLGAGEHRDVAVEPGDTVVFSARVIPGGERAVSRLMGNFYRRGCDVVHAGTAAVHVSGHAGRDDLVTMIDLVRPRHLVPIHGEYRMLAQLVRLATEHGFPAERVHLLENGDILAIDGDDARREGTVPAGCVLIDGSGLEGVDEVVVQDRRHLSLGGIVVPIMVVDRQTGRLETPPEIVTRGVFDANGSRLAEEAGRVVVSSIEGQPAEERGDPDLTRERVRRDLRRFLKKRLTKRPLILPVVMEV